MKRLVTWLALLPLVACGSSDDQIVERPGEPDVHTVAPQDAAMNAAIEKARSTVAEFQKALTSTPLGADGFSVKVRFSLPDDAAEHIWLGEPSISDGVVSGVIGNEPLHATELKLGQRVSAPVGDISDWMYVQAGVLRGGYTIRALLERMPPEERAQYLAELGFKLE